MIDPAAPPANAAADAAEPAGRQPRVEGAECLDGLPDAREGLDAWLTDPAPKRAGPRVEVSAAPLEVGSQCRVPVSRVDWVPVVMVQMSVSCAGRPLFRALMERADVSGKDFSRELGATHARLIAAALAP